MPKFVSTPCTDEDGHVLVEQPKDPRDSTNTNLGELQPHDPIQHSSDGQQGIVTPDSEDEEQHRVIDDEADFDSLVTDLNDQFDITEENDSGLKVNRMVDHRYL